MWFSSTFLWSPCVKQHLFGRPSSELPCFETVKHAISRVCPSLLIQSCGASDSEYPFVFHISWELQHFVIQHFGYFVISECLEPGSFLSKMTCLLELSTGKLQKCKKNTVFLTRNPYRLRSFHLGVQNISKIGSFSENIVFYAIKLNQCVFGPAAFAKM